MELKTIRWAGWMQYACNPNRKKGKVLQPEELFILPEIKEKKELILPTKEEMIFFKNWFKKK